MTKPSEDPGESLEMRKQLLITQGAMYRSGIKSSKEKVVAGLRGGTLARSALKQVGMVALSAWRNRTGLAASLPAAVPMVLGTVTKLWKQRQIKPVLRGVAIAGVAASAVVLLAKWARRKRQATEHGELPNEDAAYVPQAPGPSDEISDSIIVPS